MRNGIAASALALLAGLWAAPGLAEPEVLQPSIVIGTDQRYPSEERAVGRIVTVGCTGWLTSFGAVLTAGHCNHNGPFKIQFNVPPSKSDGTINPPSSPDDIYTLVFFASALVAGQEDWAVAAASPVNGMTAAVRQKAVFRVSSLPLPSGSAAIRVTGFGVDGPPPNYGANGGPKNRFNKTNQTATGAYIGPGSRAHRLCYVADTNPADSGAPAIVNGSRIAVGIHIAGSRAAGDCGRSANIATALDQPNLVAAMQRFPGSGYGIPGDRTFFVDEESPSAVVDGTVLSPFTQLSAAAAKANSTDAEALITIAPGSYVDQPFTISAGHNITISLPAGDAKLYLHGD
ncbi:MAG TPA: trypsin-like serine protease [Allosphingosinicella sp.]